MDFFYFLVTGSKAWEPHYYESFFNAQGGFLWGIIGALIIGVICACAFYFGCCNSKKSSKSANLGGAITMLLCAVIAYFYADLVVIGDSATTDNASIFRTHSFYKAKFENVTGKMYGDLDNLCQNSRNHFDNIDSATKPSNVIVDVVNVGYVVDGKIGRITSVLTY